jgi:poly-gamma-glutamate synthesis protein (capsule biosynthesis protein)
MNGRDLPTDPPWLVGHLDPAVVEADAAAASAAGAEFVVVSLHWGEEYTSQPTGRQAVMVERLLAVPDVDLLLGHHTHVVQPVVRRDGKAAAIGLGNFLTNQPGDEDNAYEIVPIGIDEPEQVDPALLAESAARTAAVVEPQLRRLEFTAG